jgi:hypothetical protein
MPPDWCQRPRQDVPNLQLVSGTCSHDGLNDCISSIRVRRQ